MVGANGCYPGNRMLLILTTLFITIVSCAQSPLAASLSCLQPLCDAKGAMYDQCLLSSIMHLSNGHFVNNDLERAVNIVETIIVNGELAGMDRLGIDEDANMQVDKPKCRFSNNEALFILSVWQRAEIYDQLNKNLIEILQLHNPVIDTLTVFIITKHPRRRHLIKDLCADLNNLHLLALLFRQSLHPEEHLMIADLLWVSLLMAEPTRVVDDELFWRLMRFEEMACRSFPDGFRESVRRGLAEEHWPVQWRAALQRFSI